VIGRVARIAGALLAKELQHHAAALLGAGALVVVGTVVTWSIGLQEDWVTLLDAALNLTAYALPALALFVAGRLVVQDHQDSTHEFLAALPISPGARAAVRFGLGFAVVEGAMLAVLVCTAALASRREGVPLGFALQLSVQLGLYLYAWYGMAFGIAHLGRFRWLVWWLLLVGLFVADAFAREPLRSVYWLGLVQDGADRARLDPPWAWVPQALIWGTAGIAVGFAVSVWRGGVLLERWFRPTTAHQRARLIGVGMAAMLGASALGDQAPERDPWDALPALDSASRAEIRVASSTGSPLWQVGVEAARELDALGEAVGVASWPPIVLLRSHPGVAERPVTRAPGLGEAPPARVLLVDPTASRPVVRQIVAAAIVHRLGGLADWDGDALWLADGLATWWVGEDRALLERRAAPVDLRADWVSLRASLGPEAAEATAALGLSALEQVAGRDAVLALARAVLSPSWQPTGPSAGRLRRITGGTARWAWVERHTGADLDAWIAAWSDALPDGPGLRVPPLEVAAEGGEVIARWSGAPPARAAIEWLALDPLQVVPLPSDPTERVVPEPGVGEVSLPADLRGRVSARWVVDDPVLGVVSGPWSEVSR
jgi:hypothetical protein